MMSPKEEAQLREMMRVFENYIRAIVTMMPQDQRLDRAREDVVTTIKAQIADERRHAP